MNILVLFALVMGSAFAGFSLRSKQLKKNRSRVMQLEKEMISNHAEILELQKEYITMELKFRGIKDPIVVMSNAQKTEGEEKLPDVTLRKKLLNKDHTPSRNEGYQMVYDSLLNKEQQATAAPY